MILTNAFATEIPPELSKERLDVIYEQYGDAFAEDSINNYIDVLVNTIIDDDTSFVRTVLEHVYSYNEKNFLIESMLFDFYLENKYEKKAKAFISNLYDLPNSELVTSNGPKIYMLIYFLNETGESKRAEEIALMINKNNNAYGILSDIYFEMNDIEKGYTYLDSSMSCGWISSAQYRFTNYDNWLPDSIKESDRYKYLFKKYQTDKDIKAIRIGKLAFRNFNLKNYKDAIEQFRKAIEIEKGTVFVDQISIFYFYTYEKWCFYYLDKIAKAIKVAKKAKKIG